MVGALGVVTVEIGLNAVLAVRTMDVSMERSTGRAIGLAIIVIAIFAAGSIWWPDDQVENKVGAQEDSEAGSQPPTQPAQPATQPAGDQTPTDGQQAATPD
jgi:hypothetical protein